MVEVIVTGATGQVGSAVADSLLERGVAIRPVGLDLDSLRRRFPDATSVARLDFRDQSTFRQAADGAAKLFLIRPPAISSVSETINAFIDTATKAGVEHIVFSSVAGAETNRIVPHHRIERHIFESGVSWTILRPGFFAQNIETAYCRDIFESHRIYVPARDGRVAFVDTRDIGEAGATVLTEKGHEGSAYHLTGPEAMDFYRVAETLTDILGREITYQPASILPYLLHLIRQGLVLPQALVQTILHVGLRRGEGAPVTPDLEQLLGRPPGTIHQYVTDRIAVLQSE